MKAVELKLICELIRNSRKSDRELAKLMGVSQPTVSRNRARLEKEGIIEYAGVPNLRKLGFEIIAITFANWKHDLRPDTRVSRAKDFIAKHSNIIFVSTGSGIGSDRVAVSVHKSYSDYADYMREIRADWEEYMTLTDSFLISLSSDNVLRPISFKYLADCLTKERSEQAL